MADTRFPSMLRVAGSSFPPAANPQVERMIGVSDPYRPTGLRVAARGGRAPCRHQCRVLHETRTRQRPGRLRRCARTDRASRPARRGRARAPVRPRARRQAATRQDPANARARPSQRGAGARHHHRISSVRPQRPPRHPVRQPARLRALRDQFGALVALSPHRSHAQARGLPCLPLAGTKDPLPLPRAEL